VAALKGAQVTLFDAKPSVGRKFLVAGRGGLNLTKQEPREEFARRYLCPDAPEKFWGEVLAEFGVQDLIDWAHGLGVETFVASTKRVYPKQLKASVLLRRWLKRLKESGVQFAMNRRWTGLARNPGGSLNLRFESKGQEEWANADRVILALGGGSWPETGSDGTWTSLLRASESEMGLGIELAPLEPANCGWEYPWPEEVLKIAEGKPLKNITVAAGCGREEVRAVGELMVTRYGLEGGALYQVGPTLRKNRELRIDFKPTFTSEQLITKLGKPKGDLLKEAGRQWRLSPEAIALVKHCAPPCHSPKALAGLVKEFPLRLTRPRPLEEAISSAGGIRWHELDANLMLKKWPGVFVAGEMVDWEAPTGGYLLQGCFSMGTRAAGAAVRELR
jgi:uncharacterized flavoprotein (TIGR03862 family)